MSSLEVTRILSKKCGIFLTRSSSFQKLKCSTTYQFHLPGSKLCKESLTQWFEKLYLKLLTMVMLWSPDLLAKIFGLNLVIENQSTAKLQKAESGILVRSHRTDAKIKTAVETPIQKVNEYTIENRLKPEVPEIFKCNPLETISKFRTFKTVKRNIFLSICVYGCVAFAYMQLVILVVGLNISSMPPGLIFLSMSLFFIGYVIFTIFVKSKPKRSETTSSSKPTSPKRYRISRSTTRRYLKFLEKRQSQIKLP